MIQLHFLPEISLRCWRQVLMGLAIISSGVFVVSANASGLPTSTPRDELEAQRLHGWQSLITQSMQISDAEKLQAVNAFFNRHIRYDEDLAVWGQVDYWASPLETLGLGAGDCEDFAVAKYFTLRLLGVSEQHLRLVYSTLSSTQQPHMVLGYWSDDQEAPVLLDNLRSQASPATQRPDLQVQFAFDTGRLYRFDQSRLVAVGDAQLLPAWEALKAKVRQESLPLSSATQPVVAEWLRLQHEI